VLRRSVETASQTVNSVFLLRALAAREMLRQRKIRCCRAAEKPAIRAECSKDQRSNSQTADMDEAARAAMALVASGLR